MRSSSSTYLPLSHVPQLLIASPPDDGLFPSTPIPAVFSSPSIPTADKPPLTPEKTYGELLEEREEEDRKRRWLREEERRQQRERRQREEERRRLKREQEEKRRQAARDEKQRRKHERDERRRRREREEEESRRRKHIPRPDPQPQREAEQRQTAEEGKPSRWRDLLKEMDAGGSGRAGRQEARRRQQEAAAVSTLWSLKDELEFKQETGGGRERSVPAALTDSGSDQAEDRGGQWEAAALSSSSSPSLSARPARRVFAAPQYASVWSSASSAVSCRPHRRRRRAAALHQGRQQQQHRYHEAYHRPSPPPAAFAQHEALLWSSSPQQPPPAASASSSLWSTPSHGLHHRASPAPSSSSFALASPSYARLLPLPVGAMAVGGPRCASPPPFVPLQCRQTAIELSSEDDAEERGLLLMGRGRGGGGHSRQEAEQEAADQQSWAVLLDGREAQTDRRAEDRLMPEDWPDVDDGSGSSHRPHTRTEDAALLQQARAVNQQAQQLQQQRPSAPLPPRLPAPSSSLLHPRRAAPPAGRRRAQVPPFVPLNSAIETRVRQDLQRMAARASEEGGGEAIGSRSAALHCIDPLAMSRAKADSREREEEERRLRRREAERKEEEAKRRRREDWMAQRLQEVERQLGHALPAPSLYSLHQPQQQQRDAQREAEEDRRRDEARMGNVELMIGRLEEKSRQIYHEMMGRDPPSTTAMPMPPPPPPPPPAAAASPVPLKARKEEAEGEEARMQRQMMELQAQDITERMTALLSSPALDAEGPSTSRAPLPPTAALHLSPSRSAAMRAREAAVASPVPLLSVHPSLLPAPMPPGEKLKLSLLRGRKQPAAARQVRPAAAAGGSRTVKLPTARPAVQQQDGRLDAEAAGLIDAFRQEFGSALRAATQQL